MLFTENQLQTPSNPFTILDEACYLTEEESSIHPLTVSILENQRLGSYLVQFDQIGRLVEESGSDLLSAMVSVAEANEIDVSEMALVINEEEIIANPEILEWTDGIVVSPLSENDFEFIFTNLILEACLDEASMDFDEDELFSILTEVTWEYLASELNSNIGKSTGYYMNPDNKALFKKMIRAVHPDAHRNEGSEAPDELVSKVLGAIYDIKHGKKASFDWGSSSTSKPKESTVSSKVSDAASSVKSSIGKVFGSKDKSSGKSSGSSSSGNSVTNKISGLLTGGGSSGSDSNSSGGSNVAKYALAAGLGAGALYAIKQYQDKPKSVIAKRIAALRNIYSKFMREAQKSPNEGIKNKLKKVAAKILGVIDKLMGFLQRKADGK